MDLFFPFSIQDFIYGSGFVSSLNKAMHKKGMKRALVHHCGYDW
jgi:hypothetical protein